MNKLIVLFLLLSTTVYGATTGNITLNGIVPAVVSITVTGVGSFNALTLATTQTDLTVANVIEQSNDSLGYKVTVSSANTGTLKNGAVGSIAYTAKYNGTSFVLSPTAVQVTNQAAQAVVVNATKALAISYTGVPNVSVMSGAYSDTLTFTITAN